MCTMCACTLYAGGPVRARQRVRVRGAAVSRRGRAAGPAIPRRLCVAAAPVRRLSALSPSSLYACQLRSLAVPD
eukprot:scaffold11383_cov123-Isochrysis_galbana.AAC.9